MLKTSKFTNIAHSLEAWIKSTYLCGYSLALNSVTSLDNLDFLQFLLSRQIFAVTDQPPMCNANMCFSLPWFEIGVRTKAKVWHTCIRIELFEGFGLPKAAVMCVLLPELKNSCPKHAKRRQDVAAAYVIHLQDQEPQASLCKEMQTYKNKMIPRPSIQ